MMISRAVPLPVIPLEPAVVVDSVETAPVPVAPPLVAAVETPQPSAPIVPPEEKAMEPPLPALLEPVLPAPELTPAFEPAIAGRAADHVGDGAAPVVGAFDRREARASDARPSFRAATPAGFDGTEPTPNRRAQTAQRVEPAGFDRPRAMRPVRTDVVAVSTSIDTPAEVVFKPVPDYTTEARALRIEGDVVLEVEFAASNEVRVLRIVHGLGHGLDEAAVEAARRIQFKPAERAGRAVDCRATVHIVFRLS